MPPKRKKPLKAKRRASNKATERPVSEQKVIRFTKKEWEDWQENKLPSELRAEIKRRGFVKAHKSDTIPKKEKELRITTPIPFLKKNKNITVLWAKPPKGRPFSTRIRLNSRTLFPIEKIFEGSELGWTMWTAILRGGSSKWRKEQIKKVAEIMASVEPESPLLRDFRILIGDELTDVLVFELGAEQFCRLVINHFKKGAGSKYYPSESKDS